MNSKLTPLALLIPAVVLAQSAPTPQPQVIKPIPNVMQAPSVDPTKAAKAASALSNAKKLSITKKLRENWNSNKVKVAGSRF